MVVVNDRQTLVEPATDQVLAQLTSLRIGMIIHKYFP